MATEGFDRFCFLEPMKVVCCIRNRAKQLDCNYQTALPKSKLLNTKRLWRSKTNPKTKTLSPKL